MNSILHRNLYFVKEHVAMFKAANNFDIFDPDSGQEIMRCREENLSLLTKILRFSGSKTMTPFDIEVKTSSGENVLQVKRGYSWFLSKVEVFDENGTLVGMFKQKFFTIGGKFDVLDANENILCTLQGKWTGWNFKFVGGDTEYAHVSKKWAGIGKELFTTADNYMLEIFENVGREDKLRILILASVMCIDMVLKEDSN